MSKNASYHSLCEKLGLSIGLDVGLLDQAFSHGSTGIGKQDRPTNYQRLEFLGDSVLGLLAAELLFEHQKDANEGILSRLRSELVSGEVFAELAEDLGLRDFIQLGPSIAQVNTRILTETFEALCGAVFLSCGFETTKAVFYPILLDKTKNLLEQDASGQSKFTSFDAKSRLQELFQERYQERPSYQHIESSGPDHSPAFRVRCVFRGETLAVASGKSKKIAEKAAAKLAFDKVETDSSKDLGHPSSFEGQTLNPAQTFVRQG